MVSVMEPPKGMSPQGELGGIRVGETRLCFKQVTWTVVGIHRFGCGTKMLIAKNRLGLHTPFHPSQLATVVRHH